jgi:hypothetical protein
MGLDFTSAGLRGFESRCVFSLDAGELDVRWNGLVAAGPEPRMRRPLTAASILSVRLSLMCLCCCVAWLVRPALALTVVIDAPETLKPLLEQHLEASRAEIGRASCRERVS